MNGRMRHREPFYTKPGKYLPEMVDTTETPDELSDPISPRTIIKDVLKPDDHIWITPSMDVVLIDLISIFYVNRNLIKLVMYKKVVGKIMHLDNQNSV